MIARFLYWLGIGSYATVGCRKCHYEETKWFLLADTAEEWAKMKELQHIFGGPHGRR